MTNVWCCLVRFGQLGKRIEHDAFPIPDDAAIFDDLRRPGCGDEGTPCDRLSPPPHSYLEGPPKIALPSCRRRRKKGEVKLDTTNDKAFLTSLLEALNIPVSSQIMVFSASSLQSEIINPRNPRALYFNEDTYIGWVPADWWRSSPPIPRWGRCFTSSTACGPAARCPT
jgi:hypothetical protein